MNVKTKKSVAKRIFTVLVAAVMTLQTVFTGLPAQVSAAGNHKITFEGFGGKTTTALVSSEWASKTGGTIDTSGELTTNGDYSNSTGARVRAYTDLGTLTEIVFEFGGKKATLSGDGLSSSGVFINSDGSVTTAQQTGSLIKYALSSGGRFIRFYKITQDFTITAKYSDVADTVSGTFVDEKNVSSSFKYDTKTTGTVIDGNTFSLPFTDLKGDNKHSVRMAIAPTENMVGLKLSKKDGTEVATYVYGNATTPQFYDGVGKVAMALSSGVYYVRFVHLMTDVVVTPLVNAAAGIYKITFDPGIGTLSGDKNYLITSEGKLDQLLSVTTPVNVSGTDYNFLGWYDEAGNKVSAATTFTKDETLTAHWSSQSFTVTFDYDGKRTNESLVVSEGQSAQKPDDPTAEGYEFVNWYTTDSYTDLYDFGTPVTGNITVYAKWQKLAGVTVSGAYGDGEDSILALDNKWVSVNAESLSGWLANGFTDEEGAALKINTAFGTIRGAEINIGTDLTVSLAKAQIISETSDVMVFVHSDGTATASPAAGDIMCLAHTAGDKYFTAAFYNVTKDIEVAFDYEDVNVTFMADGAVFDSAKVPFGGKASSPAKTPEKEGFTFDKWCEDEALTTAFSFESVLLKDTTLYARMKDIIDIEIIYGYGKAHGKENILSGVTDLEDTGYSLKGTLTNAYSGPTSGSTVNRYDHPNQSEIASVDVYYGGETAPSYTVASSLSAGGNQVIKGNVYLGSDGKLNGAEGTLLLVFAASKDSPTEPMATRWVNIPADLKIVINYFDNHSVSIDAGEGAAIERTGIPDELYSQGDGTAKVTVSGNYSETENPFALKATPASGKTTDYITFKVGSKTAVITNTNISKTVYINSSGTVTGAAGKDDIAKYSKGEFTFYNVGADIEISYTYTNLITFDPNGGVLEGSGSAYTVNGKVTALPSVVTPRIDGENTYYFMGWYDGPDMTTAGRITTNTVFTEDTTVYAGWSDVDACRVELSGVYPTGSSDIASTSTAEAWVSFDAAIGAGTLVKGYSSASGAVMNANLYYGTVKTVSVEIGENTVTIPAAELFADTDKTLYISAESTVSDQAAAGDILSLSRKAGDKTVSVSFYNVSEDICVTFAYEDLTAEFMFDGEKISTVKVPFNTAVTAPADPGSDKVIFDGWFTSEEYTETFDFSKALLEDTVIYGLAKHVHTVSIVGAGAYSVSAPVSATSWAGETGGGVDTSGTLTTKGDYESASGAQVRFYTDLGTLNGITFVFGEETVTLTGDELASAGIHINADGSKSTAKRDDTIVKYAVSNGGRFLRFFTVDQDIDISIDYSDVPEKVTATFTDGVLASTDFQVDVTTENTVVNGNSFTVPVTDLKGTNATSVRMCITPDVSVMTGLKLSDGTNEYTFVYGKSSEAKVYNGLGKVAMAYSASDGKYYVRFLYLTHDVTVTPIAVGKGVSKQVSLSASKDLSVTPDKTNKAPVTVSDDNRTITVKTGVLTGPSSATSFRWNLSTTVGSDLEYYKLEFYDKDTGSLLATIGESLISYKKAGKDQTVSLNAPVGIYARYNKSTYGEGQLRVWGVTKNIEIKVYYKNYKTGEVVSAADAAFNSVSKVRFARSAADAKAAHFAYDFVTPGTVVSGLAATVPNSELTGDNTVIKTDGDVKISGILRARIAALKMNEIESVTITDGEYSHTFTENETYVGALGNIVFARNNNAALIRFNKVYTEKEIRISATFIDNSVEPPYTVELQADKRVSYVYEPTNPKTVKTSAKNLKLTVPDNALTAGINGKSVRWTFSTLAGMTYEYSKIEIYDRDTGELLKTLGKNFVSYKDSEKDQFASAELAGLKIRYNKSVNCELQIRIWDVYRNVTLKLYYKDFKTGKEYAANNKNLKFSYNATVSVNAHGANVETEIASGAPITKVNGNSKIRFNAFAEEKNGVRYVIKPANLGERVESITVTIGGKKLTMGSSTEIYGAVGQVFPGAKVRFMKSSDGYAAFRVWGVTRNVSVSVNISSGHKYTVTYDMGEHGFMRIMDIPENAIINPEVTKITVLEGATYNSKAGNKTSIRVDAKVDPGWEIDYITFTTKGRTYKIDNKILPTGKTLTTVAKPGCAVRFNTDSDGNSQIRAVHVDADTLIKVYYRTAQYSLIVNNGARSTMKAEPYGNAAMSEFSDNFAVAKITSGNTVARQNGIKYWLEPLDGRKITGAIVENSRGEHLVMGVGFGETDYEDYKIKGATVRYYQGYDGKVELRIWGVCDDVTVTMFYDGATPVPGVTVPADIATYDVGPYDPTKRVDNMELEGDAAAKVVPEETQEAGEKDPAGENESAKTNIALVITLAVLAAAAVCAIVIVIIKSQKKKKDDK